jgi:hypothetical protein
MLIYQKLSEIITDNNSFNHQFSLEHYGLILAYADLIISPATGMANDNEYRATLIIIVENNDSLLSTYHGNSPLVFSTLHGQNDIISILK